MEVNIWIWIGIIIIGIGYMIYELDRREREKREKIECQMEIEEFQNEFQKMSKRGEVEYRLSEEDIFEIMTHNERNLNF